MKYVNIGLILFVFICFSSACFSQEFIGNKIMLQGANDVSTRANRDSTFGSNAEMSPMINSMLGGMGNMLQGFSNNSYNTQEQVKQQADYVKQQADYAKQQMEDIKD